MQKKIRRTTAQPRIVKTRQKLTKSRILPDIPNKIINIPSVQNAMNNIAFRSEFPTIITGYTVSSHLGDYYKKTVVRLVKSCIKFDLPYMVFPLKSVSDWVTGCALKPTIILHALQILKRPILWIDADAEIFKFPDLIQKLTDHEIALYSQNGHWLTGTLYFNPSVINFVDEWLQCTKPPDPDEITLLHLYTNHKTPPKLYKLPWQYNEVIHEGVDLTEFVIGHYMRPDIAASRGVIATKIPD